MIYTKEIKIKKIDNITSEYIDNELSKNYPDVLHWAIINEEPENFVLSVSIIDV